MKKPNFIELEGHVIRIANIVRVSDESYISREKVNLDDEREYTAYDLIKGHPFSISGWKSLNTSAKEAEKQRESNRAKHKELRRQAFALEHGSWLEERKDPKDNIDRVYLCTYKARYYVRLRGSRDIYLYRPSSYKKLKEAMGI